MVKTEKEKIGSENLQDMYGKVRASKITARALYYCN